MNVLPSEIKVYGVVGVGAAVIDRLFAVIELLLDTGAAVSMGQYRIWTSLAVIKHSTQQSRGRE